MIHSDHSEIFSLSFPSNFTMRRKSQRLSEILITETSSDFENPILCCCLKSKSIVLLPCKVLESGYVYFICRLSTNCCILVRRSEAVNRLSAG